MKVPYSWLKDYVDVGAMKPEEAAGRLTTVGLEVVLIESIGKDAVFDIEVTPNRPDCLSILGIARELAASLGKKAKPPRIKAAKPGWKKRPVIEIKDKNLCPRYTARIIRGVKMGPSPKWLTERIEKMGLRPVNNVVDITNFCLFELGQPTHAFDYEKLKGKITVRRSRKGEKIVTIDAKTRELEPDMLIIADEERPIALAGVMGSLGTEVTENTRDILFESAYFDPVSVRRTSRRLGLISESSYRFERSVDMDGVAIASDRASSLIYGLCGGEIGPLVEAGKRDPRPVKIYLRIEKLKNLLGIEIPAALVKKILGSLELKIETCAKGTLVVSVPSFRQDLKEEVDLIEEIIRIYGYDKLPSTMPVIVGHPRRIERPREILNITREAAASLGADEIITYSLISREDLDSLGGWDKKEPIIIKNPLSVEQEVMRTSLVPGMLRAVSWNLNRRSRDFKIFELGNIYFESAAGFIEEDNLSMAVVGDARKRENGLSFFDLKGILENIFQRLGVEEVLFTTEGLPPFVVDIGASIEAGTERLGFLGKIDKKLLERFGIETDVYLCELSLRRLFGRVRLERGFREMPRFPSASRDISLIVKKEVPYQEIVSVMKEACGDLIAQIELFDQYFGAQIPPGYKGLAYTVEYRAKDRTLTDEEVMRLHTTLCDALLRKLGATIR